VLGAIADFSAAKKKFLLAFAYGGGLFTLLLFFIGSGEVWHTLLLFLCGQICFISANVFYDAFLPQIASDEHMDRVSAKGYSFGYVGGGIQFLLALALVTFHQRLGISLDLAVRLAMIMAGLWWAGFTLFTWKNLHEAPARQAMPERFRRWPLPLAYVGIGVSRTLGTIRRVRRFRHLLLFLIAYMLYNDGIQTVIDMAAIYGKEELGLATQHLMLTLLVIQFVAWGGAFLFSAISARIGTKRAVMTTLVLWSAIVVYAYVMTSVTEFFALGVLVGTVLGGSQALSRSYYGSMIPENASAEFYGFYTVFSKFSAIWGPLTLAVLRQWTGSARLAIVSIVFFFVAGLVLLWFVDETKARQARLAGAF
jgi:UMF1 family MFS transporter